MNKDSKTHLPCLSLMLSQNRDHQASWEGAEGFLIATEDKPSLIRIEGISNVCSLVT